MVFGAVLTAALVGCGGFVYTTVGGAVKGLTADNQSVLYLGNEANFTQKLTADGPFSFRVASNAAYDIRIVTQPNPVFCTVANGVGRMASDAPVNNIVVTCVPNVQLGGTLSGLAANTSLGLSTKSAVSIEASTPAVAQAPLLVANGVFTLPYYIVSGHKYSVEVSTQPAAQVCSVLNGVGTADNSNLSAAKNIAVNCVPGVPVTVKYKSDLKASGRLTLSNNDNDSLSLTQAAVAADGTATFNKSLLNDASYNVKVSTQPYAQFCSVTGGTGTAVLTTPVTAISVGLSCVDAMSLTGTLTGLKTGASVTLANNAGDPLILSANGAFVFANSLLAEKTYAVTIATQPTGQTCTVTNGTGKAAITTPVTDPKIVVTCI